MKIIKKTIWRKEKKTGRMTMTQWRESRLMKNNLKKIVCKHSDLRKVNSQSWPKSISKACNANWLKHKSNFLMFSFLKTIKTSKSKAFNFKSMIKTVFPCPKNPSTKNSSQTVPKVWLIASITYLMHPLQFTIPTLNRVKLLETSNKSKMPLILMVKKAFMKNLKMIFSVTWSRPKSKPIKSRKLLKNSNQ